MGAAAPIALMAITTGINAYSAYQQVETANKAAELQQRQIRQQQVQLRLQENQQSIARMKNLRQILATEQVQLGSRNISSASGSVRAIYQTNFTEFSQDETASKLNYLGKQTGLDTQGQMVELERGTRVKNAVLGYFQQQLHLGMAMSGMPSGSLVNATSPPPGSSPFNLNRA